MGIVCFWAMETSIVVVQRWAVSLQGFPVHGEGGCVCDSSWFASLWITLLPSLTLTSLLDFLYLSFTSWTTLLSYISTGYLVFRLMEGGWWTFFKWFQYSLLRAYYDLMTSKPHQSYRQDIRFWLPTISVTMPTWTTSHPLSIWHRKHRAKSRSFGHHQYGIRIRFRYRYIVLRVGTQILCHPDFQPTYIERGLFYVVKPAKYVLKMLRHSIQAKLLRREKVATSLPTTVSRFDQTLYDKALAQFELKNASPFVTTHNLESFFDRTLYDQVCDSRRAARLDLRACKQNVVSHFDTTLYDNELIELEIQHECKQESDKAFHDYYGITKDLAWTIFDTFMDPLDWYLKEKELLGTSFLEQANASTNLATMFQQACQLQLDLTPSLQHLCSSQPTLRAHVLRATTPEASDMHGVYLTGQNHHSHVPIVLDTGASISITPALCKGWLAITATVTPCRRAKPTLTFGAKWACTGKKLPSSKINSMISLIS